jgi:Glycosyl transferases group 1
MSPPTDEALRALRVLIPTNRDHFRRLSYGSALHFEDAVAEMSDADLLPVALPTRRARLAALKEGRLLRPVEPPRPKYDICLFVTLDPWWMPSLSQVEGLRDVADRVVVYLYDSWLAHINLLRGRHRRVWSMVDHLFVSFAHSRDAYAAVLDCPVHYLPQAVPEDLFHPYRRDRPIDILSFGRRDPTLHRQLLGLARREDLFYYFRLFQRACLPEAKDLRDSQELLGRLCQSSGVQIHWSVESTDAARAEQGSPITARWFEAAASGAVVVGRQPKSPEFGRLFPYEGFVREVDPRNRVETERVVLEAISEREDRAERVALAEHVRTQHTWKARWREIAEVCVG